MKAASLVIITAQTLLILSSCGLLGGCMMTQRAYADSIMGDEPSQVRVGTGLVIDAVTFPVQAGVLATKKATKKQE